MAIVKAESYQTVDGRCFGTLDEAYGNEVKALLDLLPDKGEWRGRLTASMWPGSRKDLRKLVTEVRGWLVQAEASLAQMSSGMDTDKGK